MGMHSLRLRVLLALPWLCCATATAAPLLRCDVTYAGTTHTLTSQLVADPYQVSSTDIGGRFWFKPVMVGTGGRVDYITLYAYLDTPRQPVLIQAATYRAPLPRSRRGVNITGLQHLYAGPVERELIYQCTLKETGR